MKKAYILFCFTILSALSLKATHISGADFNYQCIGQDSFLITLNLFRDCTGIKAPNTGKVTFTSTCGGNKVVHLNKQNGTNGTEISQLCPGVINTSSCNGGSLPGMQQHIYTGIVVLAPRCDTWTMTWSLCCRNNTVNLVNQPRLMVSATINNATDSCNNSPIFNAQPILYVCQNQSVDYNFAVTEPDGDSLVYTFVDPLDKMTGGTPTAVPFAIGYSAIQPFPGIVLNTSTGQLNFTPTLQGNYVLAIRVCEYEYGTGLLKGCVTRDIQFVVIVCSNNQPMGPPPGISSFTGTGVLIAMDSIQVCVGNTFSFDLVFTDPDTADSVTLTSNINQIIPGATVTIVNGNPATISISATAIASLPPLSTFVVNAIDDACPIQATTTASYNIITNKIPIVSTFPTPIACKDDVPFNSTGTVLNATGGIWSGGLGSFTQPTNQLINSYLPTAAELSSGSVDLYLTSTGNGNCAAVIDTINLLFVEFNANIIPAITDVSCNGGGDGSVSLAVNGLAPPYTVSWNTTPIQYGDTAIGLTAGTYSATLVDGNGCDSIIAYIVTEPTPLTSSVIAISHVNCTNGNDGLATVSGSGGVGPYSYLWDASAGSQTTSIGVNLFAGTYAVSVTDSKGCMVVQSVTITQPIYAMSLTVTANDITCFGLSDGSATVSATGGTLPYIYAWNPGNQSTDTINNLSASTNSVTVTDNSGRCVVQTGIVINEPANLSSVDNATPVNCYGESNGVANVTVNGGITPYAYQWGPAAGNQTNASVSGLSAGTYLVTITDSNNCVFDTSVIVDEPNDFTLTAIDTIVSCNGGSDGLVQVGVTGGVTPYTISWNTAPIQTGFQANNLGIGSYTASILDSNGCDTNITITVTEPTVLTSSITFINHVYCKGGDDGVAVAAGSGGMPPYSYIWSANSLNQIGDTASGLLSGTYTVTVTDSLGCTVVDTAIITQPTHNLSVSVSHTDITCFGLTNGTATASATGGTSPYTYLWSPGNQTANAITNLPASNNTVTVTDNSGFCVVFHDIVILEPSAVTSSDTSLDVSCYGGSNGTATVFATGGNGPYTYLWDAAAASQTDSTANSLASATYQVTITDTKGCDFNTNVFVYQPDSLDLTNLNVEPLCYGEANGSMEVNAFGGISPYTFLWGVNALNQTDSIAINLSEGAYNLRITDSNNCVLDTNLNLTQPDSVSVSSVVISPVLCYGDSTASACVFGDGGTTPYSYQWNISAQLEASGEALNMAAGTYYVTVTDTNGCTFDTSIIITQPAFPLDLSSIIVMDVSCFGDSNGTATVTPFGGTTPYTFQWDSLTGNQTQATAINLKQDTFWVVVTDSNACVDSTSVTVSQPQSLLIMTTLANNVLCYGDSTGDATVIPSGGTSPYYYAWDANAQNQTDSTAGNLTLGDYYVVVTDTNGCTIDTNVIVSQPDTLDFSNLKTMPLCFGGSDGLIEINAIGGVLPYTFLWDANAANQTDSVAVNLNAGSFNVSITDSNSCVIDTLLVLTQPTLLGAISIFNNSVLCYGDSTASTWIFGSGGTLPYTYQWNTSTQPSPIGEKTNMYAGTHLVTITDTNGCTFDTNVIITQPTLPIDLSAITIQDVSCFGDSNGTATVTPIGGTSPYTYQWDSLAGNQTLPTAVNLYYNTYEVVVTDSNACVDSITVMVSQPQSLLIMNAVANNVLCFGDATGDATVIPTGGTRPYYYAWDANAQFQIDSIATNLALGTYNVVVTDTLGCIIDTTFSVGEPLILNAAAEVSDVDCFGNNSGTATVFAQGGISPYNYLWDVTANNQVDSIATMLATGNHLVSITDSNGCVFDTTLFIDQPLAALNVDSNQVPVICFNENTGKAIAIATGGTTPYYFQWSGGLNTQTTDTATSLFTGLYSVIVTDINGCTDATFVTVTEPSLVQAISTSNSSVNCFEGGDGSATVVGSGGISPYTYLWPSAAASQIDSTALNLLTGGYVVTVTDSNGCTATDSVYISQPLMELSVATSTVLPLCFGDNNGSAISSVTGGTAPYTCLWSANSGSQVTETAFNLFQGTYGLTVTDTNGCVTTTDVILLEPSPLVFGSTSQTGVNCLGGADGSASVMPSGGTSPYYYLWDNAANNQVNAIASQLSTGTYGVTITDQNGCFNDSTVTVSQPARALNSTPTISNVNCRNGADGEVSIAVTGGTNPYQIVWSANTGNQTGATAYNLGNGSYQAIITDTNGCLDTVNVTVNQPATSLSLTSNKVGVSCNGFTDGQASIVVIGGTAPYISIWDAATGSQTGTQAINLGAGNYQVITTDQNGCKDSIMTLVTEPQAISIYVSPDDTVCTDANFNLWVNAVGGNGNYSYTWNQGLSNSDLHTITTNVSNTYTVSVTDYLGCPGVTGSMDITVNHIYLDSLSVWSAGDVCAGDTTILNADYNGSFGPYDYSWSHALGKGKGPKQVTPFATTIYQVTLTDQCGSSVTDFVVVNLLQSPVISVPEIVEEGCGPLTVFFNDHITNVGNYDYYWHFGDGNSSSNSTPTHTYNAAGTYNITVIKTSALGCTATSNGQSRVIVYPTPVADASADKYITDITASTINFTNLSVGASSIRWDFSPLDFSVDQTPSYTYPAIGTYGVLLTATNQYGCTSEFNLEIVVTNDGKLKAPNAFIPNPEGGNGGTYDANSLANDVFYVRTEDVDRFHMVILNRWGEMIFETFDVNIGWDGYYLGKVSAQDVYVWKIDIVYLDGEQISEVGNLTLLN